MPWIVSGTRVLASAEVAASRSARRRGLLGRDAHRGGFVIPGCRSVHTLGMRFPIDVAFVDADGTVLRIARMNRHRIGRPVWKSDLVIEAEAGAFERWGLHVGDVVEIRAESSDGAAPTADDPRTARRPSAAVQDEPTTRSITPPILVRNTHDAEASGDRVDAHAWT